MPHRATSPKPLSGLSLPRRRFLQGALLGSLGAAAAVAPASRARDAADGGGSRQRRVLVLGAGMAGLTAALALLRRGHAVQVIEYQNRVGGRLLSLPLKGGQFSEAGGGHFRSNMPYVLSYIRHFKLPLLTLNDGLPRYFFDGKSADAADLESWPWDLAAAERLVSVASTLNHYLFLNGLDADSVLDADWPDPQAIAQLDGITVGELVRRVGGSAAFLKLLDAHGGTFTSRSAALGAIPDLAYHFGDQNLFRIQGGNERLPRAMAQALQQPVVLNAPVVAIDQDPGRVRVTVKDGREFHADALISTIPFTVLQDVAVRPGWSEGKRRMFAAMEWDTTVKVIAQTQSPAWLSRNVHGWPMAGSDRSWERVIDITGNEAGGYGNTFFYLNGANAEAALARRGSDREAAVLDQFRSDLPDLFDQVVTLRSFAWSEQPWIRASFGSPPINGAWMIQEWSRPEGAIHFAGDFTTMKSGWVEGAIESGLRAARQIDPRARPEATHFLRQERQDP